MDNVTYTLLKKKIAAVQTQVTGLAEGFTYKGSVASVDDLPDDADAGDLYTVAGKKYVWDGEAWVHLEDYDLDTTLSEQGKPADAKAVGDALATKVPTTTTVAGKALSSNVTLDAGDIGYDGTETYDDGTIGAEVSDLKTFLDNGSLYIDIMGDAVSSASASRKFAIRKNHVEVIKTGNSSTYKFCNLFGSPTINSSNSWANADISNDYFCPVGFDTSKYDLVLYVEWNENNSQWRNLIHSATKNTTTGVVTKNENNAATDDQAKGKIQRTVLTNLLPEIRENGNFALYILNGNTNYANSFRYWLRAEKIDEFEGAFVEEGSTWED